MFRRTKLRGPIGRIYPIFIISAHVLGAGEFMLRRELIGSGMEISNGPVVITVITALFFALMGIYQWIRYKLWVYFILGMLAGVSTLQSICQYTDFFTIQSYLINILLVILFIVIAWPVLAGQEYFEAKARRLLKLAADSIDETQDGYTARPFSAGKAEYSPEQIVGFARWIKSKHIASPLYRPEGIFLLFSTGKSILTEPEPEEVSYVLFGNSGDISVHISAFDYKQFTRRFSFDRICGSLGNNFQRFLEYYKEGHEKRILDELKSV